jgi:hypothetical protein
MIDLSHYRSSRFIYRMSVASFATSIIPSHHLGGEKLIHTLLGIEATPSAVLDSTEWKPRLVAHSHAIDVDRTVTMLGLGEGGGLHNIDSPALNLFGNCKALPKICREH